MKIELRHRRHGVHTPRKTTDIPGEFADYAKPGRPPLPNEIAEHWDIDEAKLLAALPAGFLPVRPSSTLLTVSDAHGGSGQDGLSVFRNWGKYFDAWVIDLERPGEPAPHALDGILGRGTATA